MHDETKAPGITLRLGTVDLYERIKRIAEYEGRSMGKQIEQFLRDDVRRFEQEHSEVLSGN